MEKTFLTAGIVITALTAFAFSQHKQSFYKNIPLLQPAQIAHNKIEKDTVPQKPNDASTYTFSSTINGKQYKLVEINGKLTEFYVDNVRIPGDKISAYSDIIAELKKNIATAKQNENAETAAQSEALKARTEAIIAKKLIADSQSRVNAKIAEVQMKELQEDIMRAKQTNDSDKMRRSIDALKAEAEVMHQKALAMSDANAKISIDRLEAIKSAQSDVHKELIEVQAEKLAQASKESEPVKAQLEKLEAIAKEQAMIIGQSEKQSKNIKDKTDKRLNEELKKQIEQLKQQNEELKQQLRQRTDSLRATPASFMGA